MVTVSIGSDKIVLDVEGMDQLWSLRSRLEFPLSHITSVRVDREAARGWWHGLRIMGTNVPGVLTAGTYYQDGGIVFYDVHDPDNTVVMELDHERYRRLIVEVENPEDTRDRIARAIGKR